MLDKRTENPVRSLHLLFLILVVVLPLCGHQSTARAATWVVPVGDDIQTAIDAAADLDTIQLAGGLYTLPDGESLAILNKSLTIIGQAGATTVQGNGNRVFDINTSNVTLGNLIIRGGDVEYDVGAGIYQHGGTLTLKNCEITDNGSEWVDVGGAIAIITGKLGIIESRIHDNMAWISPGIYAEDAAIEVNSTDIYDNTGLELAGVDLEAGCDSSDMWNGAGGGLTAHYSQVKIHKTNINNNLNTFGGALGLFFSDLDLSESTVTQNQSYCEAGGVLMESSHGVISATVINLNQTRSAEYGVGGGLYLDRVNSLDITASEIRGNKATAVGGGIYTVESNTTISFSTIADNIAESTDYGAGGGIYIEVYATVTISNSTISGNTATNGGGGIWMQSDGMSVEDFAGSSGKHVLLAMNRSKAASNSEWSAPASVIDNVLMLTNSTVSGNSAQVRGGGLAIGERAYLNFTTITNNTSAEGGGLYADEYSIIYHGSNIVAGNTALDGTTASDWFTEVDDVEPYPTEIVSSGGNLIGDNTGSLFMAGNPNADGDYVGTVGSAIDPLLGPLADNGGLTLTHALTSEASPAVNRAADTVDVDQRGYERPYPEDGACDIGAVEYFGTADLVLTKRVDNATPLVGDQVTYALTITNNGPQQASGVTVTDELPASVIYVSDNSGGRYNHENGIWTIGVMAPSDTQELRITVLVNQSGTITNTATAGAATTDTTPASDSAVLNAVLPQAAILTLTKTVDEDEPRVGESVTYTLTLTNNGPGRAEAVKGVDLLPSGLTYQSDSSSGNYDEVTGVWTIGDLNPTDVRQLTITAMVTRTGTITNTASAFSSTVGANSPTAAVDIVATQVVDVTLALDKTVNNAQPRVGDQVTYTLTVTNQGADQAVQVVVSDLLPAGLTYVSDNAGGSYSSATGLWSVGNLDGGGSANAQLEITATVNLPGTITNTATAFAANSGGQGANAKVDIIAAPVQDQALYLLKNVSKATPVIGEQVTYILTVFYVGNDQGEGIRVMDLLPAGVTYVADDSGGAYQADTGEWTIGAMEQYDARQLKITAQVAQLGAITNTATAYSDTPGGDPVIASADILASEEVIGTLGLTITVDNLTPKVEDRITYTLVVANNGQELIEDVKVIDLLPTGLTYVSDDSGGDFDTATGMWTIGDLPASGTRELNITVIAAMEGLITNIGTAYSAAGDAIPVTGSATIAAWQSKGGGGGGSGCFINSLK